MPALMLPVSQLQAQRLMTSQIRSCMEYLRSASNILMLILHSQFIQNIAILATLSTNIDIIRCELTLFWIILYTVWY